MRADAVALIRHAAKVDVSRASENHERGPASRVTALVLRGVVKAVGKGTVKAGGNVGGEAALKAQGTLKALSLSRMGTMGGVLDGQPEAQPYPARLYRFT